jgi:tetratricopeptide (TPR) repeat protein
MSIKHLPARSALAAALAVALLLGGCSTAPKQSKTGAGALPESNEPDLVAQLRARMASGNLPRKARATETAPTSARSDTSNAPAVTVDPIKQQAAMAVGADYARALTLMKAGSDAEALALLRQIGAKVPQFSGPLVNQAVILIKQARHAEAEKALRDALKINPRNPFAGNLLGIALREQGKFTDARAAYEAALAIDPKYAKAHFNLGVLADLYLQDLPLALSHYERYQRLQSNPDPAVANWIVDLQKRTGVYKAPPRPVAPAPVAEPEEEAPAATETPATAAPAPGAAVAQEQKNPS